MTPDQRAAAFNREAARQAKVLPRIQRRTLQTIQLELRRAQREVIAALAKGDLSESRLRDLTRMKSEIAASLERFGTTARQAIETGAGRAHAAALQGAIKSFDAAGFKVPIKVSDRQLQALSQTLTPLIGGITSRQINAVNSALAQNVIGTRGFADTIKDVKQILGASETRARTIAFTELGRVHSTAQMAAMREQLKLLPGLQKRWQQSTKLHKRASHLRAAGQIVPAEEPFIVDGEKLMFPRDPSASGRNTINCGCGMVPVTNGSNFGASQVRLDPFDKSSAMSLTPRTRTASTVVTPAASTVSEYVALGKQSLEELLAVSDVADLRDELARELKGRHGGGTIKFAGSYIDDEAWIDIGSLLPRNWVDAANAKPPKLKTSTGRASYRRGKGNGTPTLTTDGSWRTHLHEYSHHLQAMLPELDALFQALHTSRTAGQPLRSLRTLTGLPYGRYEVTREDNYIDAYFGREYGGDNGALEMMAMGIENVLALGGRGLRRLLERDREMAEFVIGLLLHWRTP